MAKFNVGDLIQITKESQHMTQWALDAAQDEIVYEILEIEADSYRSKNLTNGEIYGIAFKHAVPAKNSLAQIEKESKKF